MLRVKSSFTVLDSARWLVGRSRLTWGLSAGTESFTFYFIVFFRQITHRARKITVPGKSQIRKCILRVLLTGDQVTDGAIADYRQYGLNTDVFHCFRDGEHSLNMVAYGAVIIMCRYAEDNELSALKRWRKNGMVMPVLVISDPAEVCVRVAVLNAGADDWLASPAAPLEVIARIQAILRRGTASPASVLQAGSVAFDIGSQSVMLRGENVRLTKRETTILELLLRCYPRILTRRYLEDNLCTWEREISSNTMEVHISNLRRKLGHYIIETVHGTGYRLRPPE